MFLLGSVSHMVVIIWFDQLDYLYGPNRQFIPYRAGYSRPGRPVLVLFICDLVWWEWKSQSERRWPVASRYPCTHVWSTKCCSWPVSAHYTCAFTYLDWILKYLIRSN